MNVTGFAYKISWLKLFRDSTNSITNNMCDGTHIYQYKYVLNIYIVF